MATITALVQIQVTLPALNGASLDAILAWLNTNIIAKLPSTATATITFTNMTP